MKLVKKASIVSIFCLLFVFLFSLTASADITACGAVAASDRLTANVVQAGGGDCLIVTANDVQIDCNGFTLTFNTDGAGSGSAIRISNRTNVNVTNCQIFGGNRSATVPGIFTSAINVSESNFTNIRNNTIHVNGTHNGTASVHYGIALSNTSINTTIYNNTFIVGTNMGMGVNSTSPAIFGDFRIRNSTIANNTITHINVSGFNNSGIVLQNQAYNNTIVNNTITTNSTLGSNNHGIHLRSSASENTVSGNNIITNGTANNTAIVLESIANNNTIFSNTIHGNGSGIENHGILLFNIAIGNSVVLNTIQTNGNGNNTGIKLATNVHNNTFDRNKITTHGSGFDRNFGIHLINNILNNTFRNNNVTANHSDDARQGSALRFDTSANNNTFINDSFAMIRGHENLSFVIFFNGSADNTFENTVLNTSTGGWINNSNAGLANTFANLTYTKLYGSIRFPENITYNNTLNITHTYVNVTFNRVTVDAQNLSFLNTTAFITLRELLFNSPNSIMDLDLNNVFENCPDSRCVDVSYSGGVYIFNVTGFSGYSSEESSTGGGGSSSGGGGGSSVSHSYSMTGVSYTSPALRVNEKIKFMHKNKEHTIQVLQITNDVAVKVRVSSTPQEVVIQKGQSRLVDVDGDLVDDIKITAVDVTRNSVNLKVDKIYQPSSTPASTTAPAQPSSTSPESSSTSSSDSSGTQSANTAPAQPAAPVAQPLPVADEMRYDAPSASNTVLIFGVVLFFVIIGAFVYLWQSKKF